MIYVPPDSFNLSSTDGHSHDLLFLTLSITPHKHYCTYILKICCFTLRDIKIFSHSCGTNGKKYLCETPSFL